MSPPTVTDGSAWARLADRGSRRDGDRYAAVELQAKSRVNLARSQVFVANMHAT